MPDYQMKVEVSFPEWNSLSNTQRSLINFFMKDAALYIIPEISETGINDTLSETSYDYSKLYGCIQSKYRCFCADGYQGGGLASEMLTIPYTSNTFTLANNEEAVTYSGVQMKYETEFTQKTSSMLMIYSDMLRPDYYDVDTHGDRPSDNEQYIHSKRISDIVGVSDLFSTPVNITPKVYTNNEWQENFNTSITTELSPLSVIPISTSSNSSLEYKFQLRTSNFGILTYENVLHKVYYKIGVCPYEMNIPSDSITVSQYVNNLKSTTIGGGLIVLNGLNILIQACCGRNLTMFSLYTNSNNGHSSNYDYNYMNYPNGYTYSYNNFEVPLNEMAHYNPSRDAITAYIDTVPTRLIIPDSNGLVYAELYDTTTGQPANLIFDNDAIMCLQVSGDNITYVDDVVEVINESGGSWIHTNEDQLIRLLITDEHLDDNAFIPTPHTPVIIPSVGSIVLIGLLNGAITLNAGESHIINSWLNGPEGNAFLEVGDAFAVISFYDSNDNEYHGELSVVIDENDNFYIHNDTDSSIEIHSDVDIAICYSADGTANTAASVIKVKNQSNNLYNAFTYNYNGLDIYYVLDYDYDHNKYHNEWTDDLSSIGYSLVE